MTETTVNSPAPTCDCGPDCTCGCQEGKPCTCGTSQVNAESTDRRIQLRGDVIGTTTYTITGMTCEHCVKAIKDEVSEVEGVTDVRVDLGTGAMEVTTDRPVDFDRLVEAVAEAGDYTLE